MTSEQLFQLRMKILEANRRRKWFINALQCKLLLQHEIPAYKNSILHYLTEWRQYAANHKVNYF